MVQSKLLNQFPHLKHYFFDSSDCSVLSEYIGQKTKIVQMKQLHTDKVILINKLSKFINNVDGIVTDAKIYLGIKTADCLPIMFYDSQKRIIAAVHAGWKGLVTGIINTTFKTMKKLNADPENIKIAVGPHIKVCCYKVSYKRVDRFLKHKLPRNIFHKKSGYFLDLSKICKHLLLKEGVKGESIDISQICTCCDKRFFSFRRQGMVPGVINNVIGLINN